MRLGIRDSRRPNPALGTEWRRGNRLTGCPSCLALIHQHGDNQLDQPGGQLSREYKSLLGDGEIGSVGTSPIRGKNLVNQIVGRGSSTQEVRASNLHFGPYWDPLESRRA